MTRLSHLEMYTRASKFKDEFKDSKYEKGETQLFYREFFNIFGISVRSVAVFEKIVKGKGNSQFIDLFWPGVLLVEQKSAGRNLEKALEQAYNYIIKLKKEDDKPRFVMACDFQTFVLVDLEDNTRHEFRLEALPEKLEYFRFMMGEEEHNLHDEDPVSIEISEMMGKIYTKLSDTNYGEHDTKALLTKLVYCMFADDTMIFNRNGMFHNYLTNHTSKDASDVGEKLVRLFEVLNRKESDRQLNMGKPLADFPYIDGSLFGDRINTPTFDSTMREMLINASNADWSKVSPAIFGSLFESVMSSEERHDDGAHYTSEKNILRVINPLFMDDLKNEFDVLSKLKIGKTKKLQEFQNKLSRLKFLDPACGSGNFLILAYREIRRLEMAVIREIRKDKVLIGDATNILSKVDVNQFYGIEINEYAAKITETSLWMMDHLMNNELSSEYGESYTRIPLQKKPNICHMDALEFDWNNLLKSSECSYVFGNPPFIGSRKMNDSQKAQMIKITKNRSLDYVCAWFAKASKYVCKNTPIGFVATNSIVQGSIVSPLWKILSKTNVSIFYAYTTFKWITSSKGTANVAVIIMGLSKDNTRERRLYHMDDNLEVEENPPHITEYLEASDDKSFPVVGTSKPLNGLPNVAFGMQPIDGGNYIFTDEQKSKFLKLEPNSKKYFRPFVNAKELINGNSRWILLLLNVNEDKLKSLPHVKERMMRVKKYRLTSSRKATQDLAVDPRDVAFPTMPKNRFLAIPGVSSEKRRYVPMMFLDPPTLVSNACFAIDGASIDLFTLLTSHMFMLWLRHVGGKLETRLRFSANNVYNTFPIPKNYTSLAKYGQIVLDVRKKYPKLTLADMYSRDTMPKDLRIAHKKLDIAVENLYRKGGFMNDQERINFMLTEYKKMIESLKKDQ